MMGNRNRFPIIPTRTRFRYYTFIQDKEFDYRGMSRYLRAKYNDAYTNYCASFSKLSEEELKKYVTDPERYQKAAVDAAKEVMRTRNAS